MYNATSLTSGHILTPPTRMPQQRGAVFLLSVYLSAMILLLLTGIALQRTMTEMRAAEMSRNLQQAFWLAESGVDSGMARAKQGALVDQQSYALSTVMGTATLQPELVSGEILLPSIGQATRQHLIRRITGTGTGAKNLTAQVQAEIDEVSSLQGVWGNGVVVAVGGAAANNATFLTGTMHSLTGAMSATLEGAPPIYDMWSLLKNAPRSGAVAFRGLADGTRKKSNETYKAALERQVSPELKSIKVGYEMVKGTVLGASSGENDQGVKYVSAPEENKIANITGAGSVGLIQPIPSIPLKQALPFGIKPAQCGKDLVLDGGSIIGGGNYYNAFSNNPKLITPGYNDGTIKDLSSDPEKIILCVNSIIPDPNNWWGYASGAAFNEPPAVVFTKPATIYVTGSSRIKFQDMSLGGLAGFLGAANLADLLNSKANGGIQTEWDISLAAKLSTTTRVPNGINIVATETTQPGIIWIEPYLFSGSIYAPQSTVILRERDPGTIRYVGQWQWDPVSRQWMWVNVFAPLEIGSIVGKEVVVELEDDMIRFGQSDPNGTRGTVNILSWQDRSRTATLTN